MAIGSVGSTAAATKSADLDRAQLAREATKLAADNRAQAADRITRADEAAALKDEQTVRSSSTLGNAFDMYL
jgi:hypothetical protein